MQTSSTSNLEHPRVVVTGFGAITAAGPTVEDLRTALRGNATKIHDVTLFSTEGLRTHIAGQIDALPDGSLMTRSIRRRASRTDRMALLAHEQALERSRLDPARLAPQRIGTVIGSSTGGMFETESFFETRLKGTKATRLRPQLLAATVGAPEDLVATSVGALGPRVAPSTACSSSAIALALARLWILAGRADVVLTGGTDALCRMTFTGFHALQAMSPEPCRPFDRDRQGISLGEGAGILILESEAHAEARGAPILAELAGAGLSCDATHPTAPHDQSRGAVQALELALGSAGVSPDQVDYLNAHGTGTQQNDASEAQAIRRVFGEAAGRLAVSATKGLIGHLLGAAGAVEAIVALLAMQDSFVPPTVGLANPDPACELNHVYGKARECPVAVAVSNSYGFGGNNCSVVLRQP